MKPIGKYIAVKDIAEEVKTKSGLIMSGDDMQQMRYRKATVIKPGTDVSVIKENDIVYYDKGHGFTMLIKEEQYTIIREADVVVVE
jgi:co-chaperonin GroES (HSP10)